MRLSTWSVLKHWSCTGTCSPTHENVHPTPKRFRPNWNIALQRDSSFVFLERSVLWLQVAIKITGTSSRISQRFQHEERESQNDTLCDVRPTHLLFYHICNVVSAGSVCLDGMIIVWVGWHYSLPVSKIIVFLLQETQLINVSKCMSDL